MLNRIYLKLPQFCIWSQPSGSDQKGPDPTGSRSGSATLLFTHKMTIKKITAIDFSIALHNYCRKMQGVFAIFYYTKWGKIVNLPVTVSGLNCAYKRQEFQSAKVVPQTGFIIWKLHNT
jgi:hypothetical protein